MKRLRTWLAMLLIWLFLFYNIERISEPMNVASFVYVFVIASALTVLLFKPLINIQSYWFYIVALPLYFAFRLVTGHTLLGNIPVVITEMVAIVVTIMLSMQVVSQLSEIEEVVFRLTIDPDRKETTSFEIGQSQIYREVRRARKRQQPLSILAISVSENSLQLNISRFLKEFQQEVIRRYVNARLGHLLLERLHSTDIITQRNQHFVVLMPETGRPEAGRVVERLQNLANEQLGLGIKIGISTFPDEATTFDQLLYNAESQMLEGEEMVMVSLPQSEEVRMTETAHS